jgi:hypothetical protein
MGDETDGAVADQTDGQGPDPAEDVSLGDGAQGARGRGRETDPADESSADHPDSADEADDEAFTRALADGELDELEVDRDGKARKRESAPKAKPKPKETPAEGEPEAEAEPEAQEPPAEEPGEAETEEKSEDPDELSETDKQLLERARTKGQRADLQNLFKERSKLRNDLKTASQAKQFADSVIDHAKSAGITQPQELATLIEQEKYLRSQPKEKAAEYLRKLADTFDPPKAAPEPVKLDDKLQDAVDAGFLTKEQAETVARAQQPPKPQTQRQEQPNQPDPAAAARAEQDAGFAEIAKVTKPYTDRYKADWPKIGAEVQKLLNERLPDVKVSAWGKEAKRVIDEVIAKRQRAALKTPTKTIGARSAPAKAAADLMSEEDELDALTKGRL